MKNYRWTGALVALALILPACGTSGASPTAGGATPTSAATGAEPTEGGGPITGLAGELELWHSYSSGAGTELQALEEALARAGRQPRPERHRDRGAVRPALQQDQYRLGSR